MLVRHSLVYLLARGIPGVFNFFAIAAYTRLLSPDEYGRYALVLAGVGLANVVFFQWMQLSLLRFWPAHEDKPNVLVSTILAANLVVAVLTGAFGVGLALLWPDPKLQPLIFLGIPILWIDAWFQLHLAVKRIQLQPHRFGLLLTLKTISAVLLGVSLALWGLGALAPLLGLLLGLVVAGALSSCDSIWRIRPRVDSALLSRLLNYGLPLTATFALGFVVSTSDRFLLAGMMGEGAAGLYSAAYDLAQQSLMLLMMVVNLAAYPLAVRALEGRGLEAASRQLRQNGTMLLMVALPGSLGMAMLAPNIASVVFGSDFRTTAEALLPVIAFAALLEGVRAFHFDLAFQLGRRTMTQVWIMFSAASSNLLFNLWWIPKFGVLGAAWATAVAYGVGLLLSICLGKRVFPVIFPWSEAFRLAFATGGMALAILPVLHLKGVVALALQLVLACVAYAILLLTMNIAGSRDTAVRLLQSRQR